MTLTCYNFEFFEFSRDFADLGANNGYKNEDRPVLSATELQPIECSLLFSGL